MIQQIDPYIYQNAYTPGTPQEADYVLFYQKGRCLIRNYGAEFSPVTVTESVQSDICQKNLQYLFSVGNRQFFLGKKLPEQLPAGTEWVSLRYFRTAMPKHHAFALVTGYQLWDWYTSHRFCSACGHLVEHSKSERAMVCPQCGRTEYPKICPAVITAVVSGDRLLVTKYASGNGNYALVAGYAEIGETIEETVKREVLEETGIHVTGMRYFASQPWSFGDTLLFGFWAYADENEIPHPDGTELSEAVWLPRDQLPEDDGISLTRYMMSLFKHGKEYL